jgi:hypothetical protein
VLVLERDLAHQLLTFVNTTPTGVTFTGVLSLSPHFASTADGIE